MNKKIIGLVLVTMLAMGGLVGCTENKTSDSETTKQQEVLLQQGNDQVGLPNITNFYEKKLAKRVLELRDDSQLVTYVYTQSMSGKYVYLSKAIGYGIPYSTQFTNPEKVSRESVGGGSGSTVVTMPQADPNGLFSADGTSATWLILIDESTGEQSVAYMEPNTVVTQTKIPKRLVEEWSLPSNY